METGARGLSGQIKINRPQDPRMLIQAIPSTEGGVVKFNLEFQIFTDHGIDDVDFPRDFGCCHLENSLYIVGGDASLNQKIPCDMCYQIFYHGGRRHQSLPTSRSDLSLTHLNFKYLFASGGLGYSNELREVEMFLIDMDRWIQVPSLNQARSSHASTGFKQTTVLVFMGIGSQNKDIDSIERWTQGQTNWEVLHLIGETNRLKPTNCLRAIEIKTGEVLLWSTFLDKKAVFCFTEEGNALRVERIQQVEIPNSDHGSAVRVHQESVFAYHHRDVSFWEFKRKKWSRRHFMLVEPETFGI